MAFKRLGRPRQEEHKFKDCLWLQMEARASLGRSRTEECIA